MTDDPLVGDDDKPLLATTDDPLVGDDDKPLLATFSNNEWESLGHLSIFFSKQPSLYYQQLVLPLQM